MNIIGEIGSFIIKYQDIILAVVIIILCVAVLFAIIRACLHAKKKRQMLSQIQQSVAEIQSTVKSLSDKKTEVIYIDGRVSGVERTAQHTEDVDAAAPAAPTEEPSSCGMKRDAIKAAAEEIPQSLKFFSRDCGISKDGKTFSFEELDAQIKD